jgi:hypothetical protein
MWKENKEGIQSKTLAQILKFAGEGKLADGNECSSEFRELLTVLPLEVVREYANQLITAKETDFPDRSFALQDLVNELGKRLGFAVSPGLYRGRVGESGHDGLWIDPDDQHAIIIETKSSTTYRIRLESIARYRIELQKTRSLNESYPALIVVGESADTTDLEAQIRGSRQAWDIRVISFEALLKLATLKINTDEPDSAELIRKVLVPREYTKLDPLVDIVSFIARDVSNEIDQSSEDVDESDDKSYVSKLDTAQLRSEAKDILARKLDHGLKDVSRTLLESEDGSVGICYGQSRAYEKANYVGYWFGLRDHQIKFLDGHREKYLAYHCVGTGLLLIQWDDLQKHLGSLGQSFFRGRHWYHLHLQVSKGKIRLRPSLPHEPIDVTRWLLPSREIKST